jgi:lysophospholipid acyltransferase (LPLAT)-like uncharacterized protein
MTVAKRLSKALKALSKTDRARAVMCWLGSLYIRLVRVTGRWELVNGAVPAAYWDQNKPFLLAFWHSRILMMPYCWRRGQPINMLISHHRDGALIARTVSHFGIDTVSGSTTRGGSAALRGMLKALKSGQCVGITPDGPRGPRMRAAEGVVQIARMSGVPVIPVAYSTSRRRLLSSWDRFLVAWPFSRGVIVWGDPIEVPSGASAEAMEQARRQVEDSLNAITAEADRRMGHDPVAPQDWPTP